MKERSRFGRIAVASRALALALAVILTTAILTPAYATCDDPLGVCSTPCPSSACHGIEDCQTGFSCVPYGTVPNMPCTPGACYCEEGIWYCTGDCASVCVADEILLPATSSWGVTILALLMLCAGTGLILRRRFSRPA